MNMLFSFGHAAAIERVFGLLRELVRQADISRIENGSRNPSLNMLKKLAKGLGMQLRVEFIAEGTAQ